MMTVSHPGPHFSGNRVPLKQKPRFGGEQEYQQFLGKLREFPEESVQRLIQINEIPGGSKEHITKAKEFGAIDENVKWFNGQVIGLISHRKSNPDAREHLGDLRRAFETVIKEKGLGQNLDQKA
ncbi:MAG: hypothetical protein K0Q50_752 [Vampirovibrio sp.]|jgi:hypothetical protein|nr:hypothetical protein [Vampirovibrio sp.]